jgi:hypothetical protein
MAYWSEIRSLEMTSHHGLKLVARVDRATLEESRTKRKELVLWLVESRPDSEVLGSP